MITKSLKPEHTGISPGNCDSALRRKAVCTSATILLTRGQTHARVKLAFSSASRSGATGLSGNAGENGPFIRKITSEETRAQPWLMLLAHKKSHRPDPLRLTTRLLAPTISAA